MTKRTFRLYYTSLGTSRQVVDVYIVNSFGRVIQKSFSFTNNSTNTGRSDVNLKY
ncbi:DUF3872 domain-containing protein [Dysgonomonas mossii]|uniref:DUF3872 domain-containing protein n=2 Tax=Dysgonomonas TaxID=156973 RepID=A0A4Y9IJD7_9BACT|nr:DUF3872 domain-containing protein [Dysgonomonas mossii]TFU88667.1 DUF3872 domain-containing protein [Dysgonomonas mossii]